MNTNHHHYPQKNKNKCQCITQNLPSWDFQYTDVALVGAL